MRNELGPGCSGNCCFCLFLFVFVCFCLFFYFALIEGKKKGVVQLSCVVKKLVRTGAGVTVHFIRNKTSAEEIKARRVVIAMSPPLSAKIECVPGSSFERRQLCGAMEAGKVIKVLVAFKGI